MSTTVPRTGADWTVYTPRYARGSSILQAFVTRPGRPLLAASAAGIRSFGIWSPQNASCLSRAIHHRSFFTCFGCSPRSAATARGPSRTSPGENRARSASLPRLHRLPEPRLRVHGPQDALRPLRHASEPLVVLDRIPQGPVHHLPRQEALDPVQAQWHVRPPQHGLHHVEGL